MFEDIIEDLSKEISDQIFLKYSSRNWLTPEEANDLREVVKTVSKSKMHDALSGFFKNYASY